MSVLTRWLCFTIRPNWIISMRQACSPFSFGHNSLRMAPLTSLNYLINGIHYDSTKMASSLKPIHPQIRVPLLGITPHLGPSGRTPALHYIPTRGVVNYSKNRGKKKTVKAVAKRFHRTGSGKLKYWPSGKHKMLSKSRNHRRLLRKPRYVTKTQLKTLNKMISGW